MKHVSILEAKTDLSKLLRQLESGKEDSIIISRNGTPVAKMVLFVDAPVEKRIGVAKGKIRIPDSWEDYDNEVAALFGGSL